MTTIYRVCIEGDQTQHKSPEGVAGWVSIAEDGQTGFITADYFAVYKDGLLQALKHPVEEARLKELQESWWSSSLSGRLFSMRSSICMDCGNICMVPRLACKAACNPTGLILMWLSASVLLMITEWHWGDALLVGLMAGVCIAMHIDVLLRLWLCRKHKQQLKHIEFSRCPCCQSPHMKSVEHLADKTISLSDGRSVTIMRAGRA